MSRIIYFVRHGQTFFNKSEKLQGCCDSPLTDLGIKQAKQSAKVLKKQYFDKAFCSPLGRVRETVEILLKGRNTAIEYNDDLQEPNFGEWEGQKVEYGPLLRQCCDDLDFSPVGGESKKSLATRIKRMMQTILANTQENDRILIVAHGVVALAFLAYILDINVVDYRKQCIAKGKSYMPNAGIFIIKEEQGHFSLLQEPAIAKDIVIPKEKKKIYLYYVRHGQTLFNLHNQAQGRCDSPLTDLGLKQAHKAGFALQTIPFKRAYISSAKRAMDTAKIILAKRDIPFTIEKKLQEVCFGSLEAMHMDEKGLKTFYDCHLNHEDFTKYGGENLAMVKKRWRFILNKIYLEAKDGDYVLIVGHGTMYTILAADLLHMNRLELEEYCSKQGKKYTYNGGIARFLLDHKGIHLEALMADPQDYLQE